MADGRKLEFLLRPSNRRMLNVDQVRKRISIFNGKSDFPFQLSLPELGVISGTTELNAPPVVLKAPTGVSGFKSGAEVSFIEVASVKTSNCFYRDVAYQVVVPNPENFIPDILCYVRANVCSGADPWDHVRLYLSVCMIPKSDFGMCSFFVILELLLGLGMGYCWV